LHNYVHNEPWFLMSRWLYYLGRRCTLVIGFKNILPLCVCWYHVSHLNSRANIHVHFPWVKMNNSNKTDTNKAQRRDKGCSSKMLMWYGSLIWKKNALRQKEDGTWYLPASPCMPRCSHLRMFHELFDPQKYQQTLTFPQRKPSVK
jgi:hypothetical protein